ncbi:MAG: hypothetical protein WA775_12675 [Psychroserpens sp.]|uniref:hypothetical protein n=1 Tax=Psychroserpens sp. TaxID=2020870 RepID=UPI003C7557EC
MLRFKDFSWKDVLMMLLILGVTFGYFLDDLFIDYEEFYDDFYDYESLVYFSKMKLLIIFYSLIWFFTCRHWWKISILIVILIELLKLISIFNVNQNTFDEIEYISSIPITAPIILLLFFLSKKLTEYRLAEDLRTKLDLAIDEQFFELNNDKNEQIKKLNEKLNYVKSNNPKQEDNEYLKELIALRNEFYNL